MFQNLFFYKLYVTISLVRHLYFCTWFHLMIFFANLIQMQYGSFPAAQVNQTLVVALDPTLPATSPPKRVSDTTRVAS
jgi:hypothetical protein